MSTKRCLYPISASLLLFWMQLVFYPTAIMISNYTINPASPLQENPLCSSQLHMKNKAKWTSNSFLYHSSYPQCLSTTVQCWAQQQFQSVYICRHCNVLHKTFEWLLISFSDVLCCSNTDKTSQACRKEGTWLMSLLPSFQVKVLHFLPRVHYRLEICS